MKISRTQNAIKGVFFGYLNKIIAIIFPFIIRTIIINTLGVQYLGLNSLFSSVLTILNLADLGFSTAIVYSMYKPIAEDNTEMVNALLNFYKKVYKVVGIIVLIVGLIVMPFLPYLINGSYPADINLYSLYSVFLANNVIGYFFFAYKRSLFSAHQRNDILSKSQILISTLMYVCQIAVLLLVKNYYVYIIFLPISNLVTNLYINHLTKKTYPQYFCKGDLEKPVKDKIKKQIVALFTHRIGYVIQSSIDNICISAFMGLTLLGRFNNYYYLITSVQAFITIIKQSLVAGIGNSIIVESHEYNKNNFYKTVFLHMWLIGWCTVCFMCLYQPFMQVWVGSENMFTLPLVICLTTLFYSGEMRGIVTLYKDALGMWWEDRFKPIAISVVNLIGTLISAYLGFFEGILIATIASYVFVGLPWETHVFFKHYMKEKKLKYYLKQILYTITTLVAVVTTYFLCNLIPLNGVMKVVVNFILCLIVPNLIFVLFYFKTPEFKQIFTKEKIKSVKNKIMNKIKNLLKKIYILFLRMLPVKKNRIYFVSNFGERFSCNPKAFFEYLYKNHKDEFDFYYCLNENSTELPKEVKHHRYKSFKDLYYLYTSKYIINNFRFHTLFNKKKKQIYIQTWHGGPVPQKKIEKDAEQNLSANYIKEAKQDSSNMSLLLTGSDSICNIFKNAFWFNGEVCNFGTPRYDVFFKDNTELKNKLRKSFNIDPNSKIVLYAPTFRNSSSSNELILDNETILNSFKKYYKTNVVLLYRFHPHQTKEVKDLTFENKNIINVTSYPDSVDLEILADCLITDFSSCLADFLILDKPCFNLVTNFDSYLDNERSLYMDLKEFPYPVLKDEKELEKYLLKNKNIEQKILKKAKSFKNKIGLTEKGTACESLYNKLKSL